MLCALAEEKIDVSPFDLNPYERAIVRNADWFIGRQTREGYVDAEGDEFYGVRGDATLIAHSVTVRCYANALTGIDDYLDSARLSLNWLAARQDADGGWRRFSAFTLDGAQCAFEGFNTYQVMTGDKRYEAVLRKAADRMIAGTLRADGSLRLSNIIEIGEYAHFALLAWKTTGDDRYRTAADKILGHIERNFDEEEGFWRPFDADALRHDLLAAIARPILRFGMLYLAPRGKIVPRISEHLTPFAVKKSFPQYAMNLMDAEALIDVLDGACTFGGLKEQTRRAIAWTETYCQGPFPGSLTESKAIGSQPPVYPIAIINDTQMAALWPTTCLLIAYCGMNDPSYRDKAKAVADWILTTQDDSGGFCNFLKPDGHAMPLQSGNVNFYASMALWLFNEVYSNARIRLFTC